jgi:hypothetical protein
MSIFGWFDTNEVDAFAKAVADDLVGRIPATSEENRKEPTLERLHNANEAIISRASAFGRRHNLNWYKKAHLGNTFRWILLERGYDTKLVDTVTHNLLVAISRKSEVAG